MDFEKKMQELQNDPEFIEKIQNAETAEAACVLFAQEGIEITPDELNKAIDQANAPEGELSEDALDDVAGGLAFVTTVRFIKMVSHLVGPGVNPYRWLRK